MKKLIMLFLLFAGSVNAHEMTPTYPEMSPSYVAGIYKTTMEMFNKREDVEYYDIGVFDDNWNPVPFVTSYRVMKVEYLERVTFDIYIRSEDLGRAVYICSRSKLRKELDYRSTISSRICSKVK